MVKVHSPVFVIAEAGVNHNGDLPLAIKLCDAAHKAGADAVKFQTFRARDLVIPGAPTAEYQARNTGSLDQYQMLERLELDELSHQKIFDHCRNIGIEFFSTPFSIEAINMLVGLGVGRLKMGSGELTYKQLIVHAASTGLPLILSTGMATKIEVSEAVAWIEAVRGQLDALTLLHCTSAYPAFDDTLNLRALLDMQLEWELPIGYSDHSLGIEASLASVALGATMIEKHLTLDCSLPGPDHRASLEPDAFASMVRGIRRITAMLGDGNKAPRQDELDMARIARRSIVVVVDIEAGVDITAAMLDCRRPGTGIAPRYQDCLVGRRSLVAISSGTLLRWDLLEGGEHS